MLLKDFQIIFHKELDAIYGAQEVGSFFNLLIKHYLDLDRIALVLDPHITLTKKVEQQLFEALSRLCKQEPLQYIVGEVEFYGLPFKVSNDTLIPRPETEELVHLIINEVEQSKNENPFSILDVGTGSGCIAISLAKNIAQSQVVAIDISEGAIEVAKQNATLNNTLVTFLECDILNINTKESYLNSKTHFDIIVSNPPYVRELEKNTMKKNVVNYEPHTALFVSDTNPLIYYKAIAEFAVNNLSHEGLLFFEINQYLGQETKQLLEEIGFKNVILRKDIFGNDRMIMASK